MHTKKYAKKRRTKRMRRRSLRLLLFVAHVSLFSFSSSRGAECPLEIEKIDLNGLGNACGDATDPGKNSLLYYFSPSYLISLLELRRVLEVHHVSRASNCKRGIYRGRSEGVADRCVRDGEFVDAVGERSDDRCVFKSFSLPTRRAVDVRELHQPWSSFRHSPRSKCKQTRPQTSQPA